MFWKKKPVKPQFDISGRIQRIIEGFLDNESLTSELEDEPARVLLDWALGCARQIVQGTGDMRDDTADEAMAPRLKALRQMMRSASRLASRRSPDLDIHAELIRFYELAGKAYGRTFAPSEEDLKELFGDELPKPTEIIARLRSRVEKLL